MITDKQIDNVVNKYTKALGDTWSNSTPYYEIGIPEKDCLEFAWEVLALRPVEDTLPPTDGYYWIKLRNYHWFIGELLAGDWYVCGMENCLSHQPVEIGSRIERTANG